MNAPLKFNSQLNQYVISAEYLRYGDTIVGIIPPKDFRWIFNPNDWLYLRNIKTGKKYLYSFIFNQHCASELLFDGTVKDPIPFKNL